MKRHREEGRPCLPRGRIVAAITAILVNYLAQVPYGLHLYGPTFDMHGGGVLPATLIWFVAGLSLLIRRRQLGYGLTLCSLVADFWFYLYNVVAGTLHGYGPLYQLQRFNGVHSRVGL